MNLPLVAGTVSTFLFTASMLPMLLKAARTKDLSSYSLGNLLLANIANAVHSLYVFSLPPGPIWLLHGTYVLASAMMLSWWLRYRHAPGNPAQPAATEGFRSTEEVLAA
ncbi:hypothetical protein [Arthrobacter silvisoli]|uniref:hypothetical protein n=1 Tax=Arthrobacter silvisoli TaxID=2291022 RepID=UPI000E2114D3|nr:hypothetical protein [Arthrobacter silvisoli]